MTKLDRNERRKKRGNERYLLGVIAIIAGVLILLRNLDLFFIPHFLFSWPMILIVVGLVIAVKDNFKNNAWWILLLVGSYFLIVNNNPDWRVRQLILPVILIGVGVSFILSRKKKRWIDHNEPEASVINTTNGFTEVSQPSATASTSTSASSSSSAFSQQGTYSAENVIDATAVFGGVKKNIYSKNLRGGDVSAFFGGIEINLMNADFEKEARLDVTCIFGGCTLIVPSHWQIRSDATVIFGGIEDKRSHSGGVSTDKVLVLDGFVMFGGIDIKPGY